MSAGVVSERFPALTDALTRVLSTADAPEARPGQVEMAVAVAELGLREDPVPLAVQAPTGTGKSFAYLAPAIARAAATGTRVVVSTATRTLQGQLAGTDAPHVLGALGLARDDVAVLVGRSNYLCHARLAELCNRPRTLVDGTPGADGAPESWLAEAVSFAGESEDGRLDRAPERVFLHQAELGVGPDECPGAATCPYGDVCFAEQARDRAMQAQVVVVNHHILAFAACHRDEWINADTLVVIDEAHALTDVIEQVVGVDVTPRRVHDAIRAAVRVFTEEPAEAGSARLLTDAAFRELAGREGPLGSDAVAATLGGLATALAALESRLSRLRGQQESAPDVVRATIQRAGRRLGRVVADLQMALDASPDTVVFGEGPAERRSLRVVPLEVGEWLAAHLWSHAPRTVLTSATLGAADPDRLRGTFGLPAAAPVVRVDSPLAYEDSLLYVPDLPAPADDSRWQKAAHRELRALLDAAAGGALCLFSSWARLDAAVAALRPHLEERGVEVLVQREAPREELLSRMLGSGAVLFGAGAFWEGVDLPGPSCRLVVIDRIPFPVPGLPVQAAREERVRARGLDPFTELSLPLAARRLAQGAGRLVRRQGDRGVVAVLDPRLATARYRPALLAHLPPFRRTRTRARALDLLEQVGRER